MRRRPKNGATLPAEKAARYGAYGPYGALPRLRRPTALTAPAAPISFFYFIGHTLGGKAASSAQLTSGEEQTPECLPN